MGRKGDLAGGEVPAEVVEDDRGPLHAGQVLEAEQAKVGHLVEGHQAGVAHDGTPVDLGGVAKD